MARCQWKFRAPPAIAGCMKLLQTLFEFVFGCRHRHLSRVFTIKHRTYRVCFDCGREFDLPNVLGTGSPDFHTTRWRTNPHHAANARTNASVRWIPSPLARLDCVALVRGRTARPARDAPSVVRSVHLCLYPPTQFVGSPDGNHTLLRKSLSGRCADWLETDSQSETL